MSSYYFNIFQDLKELLSRIKWNHEKDEDDEITDIIIDIFSELKEKGSDPEKEIAAGVLNAIDFAKLQKENLLKDLYGTKSIKSLEKYIKENVTDTPTDATNATEGDIIDNAEGDNIDNTKEILERLKNVRNDSIKVIKSCAIGISMCAATSIVPPIAITIAVMVGVYVFLESIPVVNEFYKCFKQLIHCKTQKVKRKVTGFFNKVTQRNVNELIIHYVPNAVNVASEYIPNSVKLRAKNVLRIFGVRNKG